MKIRIKGNSIRYRLTKSEVRILCEKGYFEEDTSFPEVNLTYAIQSKADISHIEASFEAAKICLFVPKTLIRNWESDERVGFTHVLAINDATSLSILIEKDFVCMDRPAENQLDQYPNPKI